MNLTDLQTFSSVAETGTISGAARRLGVPKSTVSRRVQRLEDALGHELLRRSSRSVTLTDHGRALHHRTAASLRELNLAADALLHSDAEPTGRIRITTVPGFGQSRRFLSCIRGYGLRYPKMTVDVELTPRLVQLVEEGFDVGLRLHAGDLPGGPNLMSRRLSVFRRALYASPSYLEENGIPSCLEDLGDHRIVAHSVVDSAGLEWSHLGKPLVDPPPLPTPRWFMNDSAALERIALAGAGIALLPTAEEENWFAREELFRVLPDYELPGATVSLIWPASRHLAPRVRAFIDHAVETLGEPRSTL